MIAFRVSCGLVLLTSMAWIPRAWGLGQEAFGPAGDHVSTTSDWPDGVTEILKHPSRVYWQWVNGNETAYYDGGGIEQLNQLIQLFSKVQMDRHDLVLRAGQPSAKSFHGKKTPYTVSFHAPSGIYLFHARRYAATGLYSVVPRLTVHVTSEWVDKLDMLQIPENVTLRPHGFSIQNCLKHVHSTDRSLRGRAISFLGDVGDDAPEIVKTLQEVAKSDDEYVRNAAETAITKIKAAQEGEYPKLRSSVAKFLEAHPQTYRVPSNEEVLTALQRADAKYMSGMTARGTLVESVGSQSVRRRWTITAGNDRLVLSQRRDEVADQLGIGKLEDTLYIGPKRMAHLQSSRIRHDGKLLTTGPHISREPVGTTYDILIARTLWPTGRGFTRRLDAITKVQENSDGTLSVDGISTGDLKIRWELVVDPAADYLIVRAKGFRRQQKELSYFVDGAGVFRQGDYFLNHTARWQEGADSRAISFATVSISPKPEIDWVYEIEDLIEQPES